VFIVLFMTVERPHCLWIVCARILQSFCGRW